MALGLSGSNGGLVGEKNFVENDLLKRPLEISYFINNICNLSCEHCYVGYEKKTGGLSNFEWKKLFNNLIEKGALTFGNVGKEPLHTPDKTIDLLNYFKAKKINHPKLRFGLVTNGTLLEGNLVNKLRNTCLDYLDVSLDGILESHDKIRGKGNFDKTIKNLTNLPTELKNKIFISYTLMSHNKNDFKISASNLEKINIRKFLISPYISTPSPDKGLSISTKEVANFYEKIIFGKEVDFKSSANIEILLKIDYDSQKELMDELVKRKVIDVNNLLIDDYGILFNKYEQENGSRVIINYIPFSDTLSRAFRISHDGYISGCLEMFHKDYSQRAKGNLKNQKIEKYIQKLDIE